MVYTYSNPWHVKGARGYHAIRGGPATYTSVLPPRRHWGHDIFEAVTESKHRWHVVRNGWLKGRRKTLKAAKELAKQCEIERLAIRDEDFRAICEARKAAEKSAKTA